MSEPATKSDVMLLAVDILAIAVGVILLSLKLNSKIDAMKPGPNEFRGHIYGNKISLPKRELELVQGVIRRDPSYGDAVLMQEGP